MDQIPQLLVNGISLGSIIALAAVGLTLTYGILRLSNFAHGDYMTLGAYLTLMFDALLNNFLGANIFNVWLAIAISTVLMIGYALLCEKILWKPMRAKRASSTTLVILSIGLALFMRNAVILFWGAGSQRYQLPVPEALDVLGVKIRVFDLVVTVLAVVAIAGLHYLLQNTKIGKAMRAVADDIDLARVTGINVDRVVMWTWIIAGGLTALGGSMFGLIEAVRPNMGWFLILPLFASVILGGIGNPYGAIAGAFIIGIAQEVCTLFIPVQYKTGIALLIMMLVLIVRPQGLFRGTM
ncbi:branched-chain amino acid ABC transporter permease [filamentous cyanobacterium LEGE 11480]|uniref:Branched-chain amino acid ABC transporter permease n=1 Tax=Romeriopsis navalis LEGE 11480 TaxID=2777977 RepID=A0A928Z2V8_9CYAN|nr:branched-chain amino acid ABC transporter permease [Romeriopsis navalis]MBE9030811.1 branched-chain amino acid ABC transporter permease [Romeriopsis navalis LEGE 11480]